MLLVHPGTLPVTAYERLAAELTGVVLDVVDLSADRAYAHAGLDPRTPDPTLEDLADSVARRAASGGAVALLAGWSFGGLVAAVAAERTAPGTPLLLLDTVAPVSDVGAARDEVPRWFADYLGWRAGKPLPPPAGASWAGGLDELYEPALAAGALPPDTSRGGFRMLSRAYTAGLERNFRIAGAARAPRPVRAHLVKPGQGLVPKAPANGWEEFSDDLRVVDCSGDHYSMLTDTASVTTIAAEAMRLAGRE
ncbi:thioesterase [Myceligenerans sp. I2]|uniref:Thioesterase n=2 Tax=Myceligenerans indicum TaxID=2593663 RepID=A0ABS1LQF6_9MICO|nr:thioesterase [Myceligenerans indicum]